MSGTHGDNDGGRVAGSYTFAATLPNGKQCTINGYILADDDVESINKRMDVAAAVVERQRRIAEIPELEAKLQAVKDARSQLIVLAEDLSTPGKKINGQARQYLDQHSVNLRKNEEQIARGELAVMEAKAFVNNVAA